MYISSEKTRFVGYCSENSSRRNDFERFEFKNKFKHDRPGQKRFENFLARNKEILLTNAEGINKARTQVTEESIRLWFRELEELFDSIHQKDPKRIFNGDESGFALCPKTGKVLGLKGYKKSLVSF